MARLSEFRFALSQQTCFRRCLHNDGVFLRIYEPQLLKTRGHSRLTGVESEYQTADDDALGRRMVWEFV
ncbi:MAG TPA: hypothetical protein VII52_16145, partial [Gemmatimonadaceae bacterium]